jgi:hypothetical protein
VASCCEHGNEPSGEKVLELSNKSDFQMSVPQSPTHYSLQGNGDVLHQNVRLSDVFVPDNLDSDHLPINRFHILQHVRDRDFSNRAEEFTDWKRFQNISSQVISPEIQIKSGEEADEAAHDFTASVTLTCRSK